MITRRQAICNAFLTAMAAYTAARTPAQAETPVAPANPTPTAGAPAGPFVVPPLPYDYNALEPIIDAETMHLHHDKHHAAYVSNLNKAVAGYPDLQKKSVEEIITHLPAVPESIRTAVRNNGGGHYNHSLFWQMMRKPRQVAQATLLTGEMGNRPTGDLAKAIDAQFGSFGGFQEQFTRAAVGQFGSGWAWLSLGPDGSLVVEATPNQDSPLMQGRMPLLGVDVWEHAYYLKYQNRRPEYVAAFYNVINWDFVADRYKARSVVGEPSV